MSWSSQLLSFPDCSDNPLQGLTKITLHLKTFLLIQTSSERPSWSGVPSLLPAWGMQLETCFQELGGPKSECVPLLPAPRISITYKMSTPINLVPSDTTHSYYNTTDCAYSLCTFRPGDWFYSWQFVLNLFQL